MNNPLVSVIVPVYNQADYLTETLNSVLSQTYTQWECVIINDGSSDDSERIAKDFCQKDKRFLYIFQKNMGVVSARNNAINNSSGKYILPLDGDDIILPDYLDLAVNVMEKNPDINLVYCDVEFIGSRSGKLHLPKLTLKNILQAGCCVCTSMFKRESFDKIGGFKEEMKEGVEDWEFFISLMELNGRAYKIEKTLFYYRIRNHSRNNSISTETQKDLRRKVFRLHSDLYFDDYNNIKKENNELKDKYFSIVNSRSFKYYKRIIKILRKIRTTFINS